MKKLFLGILLLSVLPLFTACNDDDNTPELEPTITTLASNTPDLSILVDAVTSAGLANTLDDRSATYTVFAPTNTAFQNFLNDNNFQSLDDVPDAVLSQVLLNHVLSGEARSSGLTTGYVDMLAKESTTDNPINLYINTASGVKLNGTVNVATPDVDAANGVVHIVDKVIAVPTVVTFALADERFSILVEALTRPSFNNAFVNALTGDGPFTVFAPTNDAFVALLAELDAADPNVTIDSLDDIDDATLQAVLNYHVTSAGNVLSSTLTNNQSVPTLGGESFTIDLSNGAEIVDNRNRRTNIIITDVQAGNGVIHAIDKVLLP